MPLALNTADPLFPALTYLFAVDDDNVVKELKAGVATTRHPSTLLPNSTPTPSTSAPFGRSFRTAAGAGNYDFPGGVTFTGSQTNVNQPCSVFVVMNRYNGASGNNMADLVGGSGPLVRINATSRVSTAVYPGAPVSGAFSAGSLGSGANTICITRNSNQLNSVFVYLNGVVDPNFAGGLNNNAGQFGPISPPMTLGALGGWPAFGWVSADIVFVAVFMGYQLTAADVARLQASLTGGNAFALLQSGPLAFNGTLPNKTGTQGSLFSWGAGALASFFSGGTAPYSYTLLSGSLPAGLSLNAGTGVISGTPSVAGSFALVVRATDALGATADSNLFNLIISAPALPSITVQPANQTVTSPAPASFSVSATGVGISYQWQRNSIDIPGATAPSYTTPATSVIDGVANSGDSYRCVLSNGGGSVTSNPATLTVNPSADTTPPVLSGTLTASAVTNTSYLLSWPAATDNLAVTGYERSLDGGLNWVGVGNVLSATVSGRTPGATDNPQLRAFDGGGNRSAALTTSVTLGTGGVALLSTQPFKNASGTLLANLVIPKLAVLRLSDMANVLTLSNQTTDAAGVLTVNNAALVSGETYLLVTSDATAANFGCQPYTAS